jgi:ribosomal protein L32
MRPRCLRCGHFIRNGNYCRNCVSDYKRNMNSFFPDPKAEQLRKEYLTKMEAEMEHP